MASKKLVFGAEAREKLLTGVDILAQAVGCTLGPRGRTVVLEKNFNKYPVTKDGVTVAKNVFLEDPFENQGVQILRQAAIKTAEIAGDGTTTSTVLAQELCHRGMSAVFNGSKPIDLKKGMELALKKVIEHLRANSKPLTTNEEILQIATISANGEKEIGELIRDAICKIGKEGSLTVEPAYNLSKTELEYKEGMSIEEGFVHEKFITNREKISSELNDCYILIYDGVINSLRSMLPFFDLYHDTFSKQTHGIANDLLIIAQDVKDEALDALIINIQQGKLKSCAVRSPFKGGHQQDVLNDIAIATGATIISKDSGLTWENATLSVLGKADKVIVKNNHTTIIGGKGHPMTIEKRINEIRTLIRDSMDDTEKKFYTSRLSKLSKGIAVIKAGGTTQVEMEERRDRIEDAIFATKAAIEEGISPGGGAALAYINCLWLMNDKNIEDGPGEDIGIGYRILFDSLSAPISKIVNNAGLMWFHQSDLLEDSLSSDFYTLSSEKKNPNLGFDANKEKFVDMIKEGIIDPTKVIITALENAVSVAGILLTTECMIVYNPDDPRRDF